MAEGRPTLIKSRPWTLKSYLIYVQAVPTALPPPFHLAMGEAAAGPGFGDFSEMEKDSHLIFPLKSLTLSWWGPLAVSLLKAKNTAKNDPSPKKR